jgi:hypothetical protein
MEVCLINPPLSVNEFPHLALPLLKGYLTSRKIRCLVKDYNVEIMDDIISEGMEKVEQYFVERGMRTTLKEVKEQYQKAREVFLSKDRAGKEERAQKLINTYLRIAGSNIFDICFKPDSLDKIKRGYDSTNIYTDTSKIMSYIREVILPFFKRNPYKIIGISVPFTSQIFYALIIGRELKKIIPDCKIVLGGPQVSLFWKIIGEHQPFRQSFDAMIYGIGELALESYITTIYRNGNLADVPNLIYAGHDGTLIVNPEKKPADMEDIPLPDFSDLPLDKYIFAKLPYQMSRGCYWGRCAFCSYRDNKGYISRKTELVAEHFKEMESRYDRHIFQFIDDAIHPNILTEFGNILLKRDMKIRYDAYLRLDSGFTEEVCKHLAKSGLKNVLFGFESANQRMLNLMNKGNTPQNMLKVLKNMKNAGIQNILSCLIGFPTETKEEAWESIQFLKTNKEWYYWVYIVHFGLISDMSRDASKYGLYEIDCNNLIRYDDSGFTALGYPYKTSIGMTVSEAFSVIQEGREELGIKIFEDNFFS